MNSSFAVMLLVAALSVPMLAAEDLKTIAIKGARLIDGRSEKAIDGGVVVVKGRTIEVAGSQSSVRIPAGAQIVDLGDVTLLPGLIDTHTHILLQGDVTTEDYDVQIFKESMPYRALRASRAVGIALNNGFTTIRDLGTEGAMYTDVDVRRAIANGVIAGPRLFVSGRAMAITGAYGPLGYSPEITHPYGVMLVDGAEAGRKAVREHVANGVDWIKVYCDRSYFLLKDGSLSSIPNFTPEELKAIVDESHRLGRKVAAHAMTPVGVGIALSAGVDSIEHGIALDDRSLDQMVAKGTYYVPTLTVTELVAPGRAAEGRLIWAKIPEFHRASFQNALKKGVRIAFGTDVGGFPWDLNEAREFTYMTRFGMTPMQAIRAATVTASQLLGIESQVGTLEAGKLADVVAVPGDPTKDISVMEKVSFVMKEGEIIRK